MQIPSSGKLRGWTQHQRQHMLVAFIPGDGEEMVQCMSRRRQGSSARGGDSKVVRMGIEPREIMVMARGDNCESDEVAEEDGG